MRRLVMLLSAVLVLAACGGSGTGETTNTVVDDGPTTTARPTSPTVSTVGQETPNEPIDLVTYVAAIEDVLAGTGYEGQALDSPDVFLATGALFCEQLDSGMTPDTVMTGYIEALTGGSIEQAGDDELTVAGGVLGVGVVTLCPQHMDSLTGSS